MYNLLYTNIIDLKNQFFAYIFLNIIYRFTSLRKCVFFAFWRYVWQESMLQKWLPKQNAVNSIIILDDQGLMKLIDAAF